MPRSEERKGVDAGVEDKFMSEVVLRLDTGVDMIEMEECCLRSEAGENSVESDSSRSRDAASQASESWGMLSSLIASTNGVTGGDELRSCAKGE